MIFKEILEKNGDTVATAVSELFEAAENSQNHPQDILLIIMHGYFSELLAKPEVYEKHKVSPYMLGLDLIGHAERTHYEFIDWYRKSHCVSLKEFEDKVKIDKELEKAERLSIHIEKDIYLRFWESNMILKQMLQLSTLALGKPYDWHLNIPEYSREGSKQEIIRNEIRDRLIDICPKFYSLIKGTYLTQIRNAIAHSQFYMGGRIIGYLNYSDDPQAYCPIRVLTYIEWAEYFHNTLLLHNALKRNLDKYQDKYYEETRKTGFIEVRITKDDNSILLERLGLKKQGKDWTWLKNIEDK